MEKIGKITVKHFLNTTLANRSSISIQADNGNFIESPPSYPLYVKITFMRKTTQQKSIIDNYFENLEEAYKVYGATIEGEIKMIEDLISNEYRKRGDKFELKGLAKRCEVYKTAVPDLFFSEYLWNDFTKVIIKGRSSNMRILLHRFPTTPVFQHYNAAIKLIDNKEELLQMKSQFDNFTLFEKCMIPLKKNQNSVFDWVYGTLKDKFSFTSLKKGYTFKQTSLVVSLVDNIVLEFTRK